MTTTRDAFRIIRLPDLDEPIPFQQYAGSIEVVPEIEGSLYFWYCESPEKPEEKPLMIWLNGGPGASSLEGLMLENGPYRFVDGKIRLHPHGWNNVANMLYIDQPIGTGFAWCNGQLYDDTEAQVDEQFYTFLMKFLDVFPELRERPLYMAGESYAGHYLPSIIEYILQENAKPNATKIPIAGLLLGNAWIADGIQIGSYPDFAYAVGLIDETQQACLNEKYQQCLLAMAEGKGDDPTGPCAQVFTDLLSWTGTALGGVNQYDIRLYDHHYGSEWPTEVIALTEYLNRPDVRDEIHATVKAAEWRRQDNVVGQAMHDDDGGAIGELFAKHIELFPVLLYSGQFDLNCNHLGTDRLIHALDWHGRDEFLSAKRYTWVVDDEPAGYSRCGGNLTFLIVVGASHMAPMDKPRQTLDMVQRFLSGAPFTDYLQGG